MCTTGMSHFCHMGGSMKCISFAQASLQQQTPDFRLAEGNWPSVHWDTVSKVNSYSTQLNTCILYLREHEIQTDDADGIWKHDSDPAQSVCSESLPPSGFVLPSTEKSKQVFGSGGLHAGIGKYRMCWCSLILILWITNLLSYYSDMLMQ